jgi:hypothetical protein
MGEIIRITNKLNSSTIPEGVPSVNYVHPPTMNIMGALLLYKMWNIHLSPSPQTFSDANDTSSSKGASEKTPNISFPSSDKHNEKKHHSDLSERSIYSGNDASEGDTSSYARWVIKRDMYGNIIDAYKYY